MPTTTRVLIVQGHPDPRGGHFCHALADAYAAGASEAGHDVERLDVATLDFPSIRSRDDLEAPAPACIRLAQTMLLHADHVVLCFPIWNGTGPAYLRGFLEQVFRASFAMPDTRPGERIGFTAYFTRRKSLTGKSARVVATMAMPAFLYRWAFRPHVERNTLSVSGLSPIRESLVGSVEGRQERRRARWLARMRDLGRRAA